MADNRQPWYRVAVAKADGVKRATVHIYDEIDSWFGVSANDLIAEMDALDDVDELDIRINSPGGSAFDGINIANAIMRHPAKTTTYVDGLAASAASLIMVAADEVVVSKYGQAMLHNARAFVAGTATDMREVAAQLDKLNGSMAQLYADRAGGDAKAWSKVMNAETWYDAEELVAAGLATRVDDSTVREEVEQAVASALACASQRFKYAGRQAAPAPRASTPTPRPVVNTKEVAPVADKKTLAETLGLDADATAEDVLKAAREQLGLDGDGEQADDNVDGGDGGDVDTAVQPELAAAVATVQSAGQAVVDAERLRRLEEQAAQGAQALAAQTAAAHARVVDDAIGLGKILPAQRGQYLALMKADADTTAKLLADTPPEALVPLTELGHSLDPQAAADGNITDPRFTGWKF